MTAKLSTSEAVIAYRTMFVPSLTYSAGVTWLTKKQCEEIQKIARPAWLQAMGFNRNFPIAVAQAPRSWGGIGILDHFCEQGIRGLFTFMGHFKSGSEIGKMVVIGYETYRLIVGLPECPYQHPNKMARQIYDIQDWFAFLHDFLEENALSVSLPEVPYLQQKCVRDQALTALLSDRLSRAECRSFNRCRLFLRVTHVSDITSGDGQKLLKDAYHGSYRFQSRLNWPHQNRPSQRDWSVWKKVLKDVLLSDVHSLNLRVALGPWYGHTSRHHRTWSYYFDPSQHTLYQRRFHGWKRFEARTARMRGFIGANIGMISRLPIGLVPSTLNDTNEYSFKVRTTIRTNSHMQSRLEYCSLVKSDFSRNGGTTAHLQIWNVHNVWRWSLLAPHHSYWSAFDSQVTAYQSFLTSLWMALNHHEVDKISTASRAHVKRFRTAMSRICLKDPRYLVSRYWELESAIFSLLQGRDFIIDTFSEDWEPHHENDSLGTVNGLGAAEPTIRLHHAGVTLPSLHATREHVMALPYKTWIRKKFDWSMATFNSIAWSCYNRALTKFKGHQNSIRKYIHGWLPVADLVSKYNDHEIKTCPWCHGKERQDHVLRCPNTSALDLRHAHFEAFWQTLSQDTDPILLSSLQLQIRRWTQNPDYNSSRVGNQRLDAALQSQTRIGWTNFLRGRISIQLIEYQQRHFAEINPDSAAARAHKWGVSLILGLLNLADAVWTARCKHLHGADPYFDPEAKRKALDRLRLLYQRQNEFSAQDQFLFSRSLDEWSHVSSKTISHWCNQMEKSLRKIVRIEANRLLSSHRPIYDYFPPVESPGAVANYGPDAED